MQYIGHLLPFWTGTTRHRRVVRWCSSPEQGVTLYFICSMYSVSQKIPPDNLWQFFQNGSEFFNKITHAYYAFLSTLDYEFLFNSLQLWRSYAILSVTTQFTSCAQNVHRRPKRMLAFSDIFPKQLGIFSPNFTLQLNVHMYARM